jgi:predicted oxidoreductase
VRGVLEQIARDHQTTPGTIAFAWLLRHPSRPVPVTGSRRHEAIREAVDALRITLDAQEWTQIQTAATGREVP